MTEFELKEIPVLKPEIKIYDTTKPLNQVERESQVIVHCSYRGEDSVDAINLLSSTFLYDKDSKHKSRLVHHVNIALSPEWMDVSFGKTIMFTLVFTGLPKFCDCFDLIEECPDPGRFAVRNIKRNNSDIYSVDVSQ